MRVFAQNQFGDVLLVKHTYIQLVSSGGGVDCGEDIFDAARRELLEETNISDISHTK